MKTGPGLIKTSPAHQKSSIKNLTSCCAIDLPRHAWVWREIGWVTGRVNWTQQGIHEALINHRILKLRSGGRRLLCFEFVLQIWTHVRSIVLLLYSASDKYMHKWTERELRLTSGQPAESYWHEWEGVVQSCWWRLAEAGRNDWCFTSFAWEDYIRIDCLKVCLSLFIQ